MMAIVLVLVAGALDATCYLPHPTAAAPSSFLEATYSASPKCLAAHKVRRNYWSHLEEWGQRLKVFRNNLQQAEADVLALSPDSSEENAIVAETATSPACRLAAASIREREAARIEARLQGSAGLHLFLILRDIFVYRSTSPFTFEAMMRHRRAKMEQAGDTAISDDDVCLAIVDASLRTSKAFDAMAEEQERQQRSYFIEIVHNYGLIVCVLVALAWVAEVIFARCVKNIVK